MVVIQAGGGWESFELQPASAEIAENSGRSEATCSFTTSSLSGNLIADQWSYSYECHC